MAFVFFRSDFGYLEGMGDLAVILIQYLPEYEAAKSFINLIHHYHFLPFYKGDLREI